MSTTETQLVLPSLESDMEVAPLALRETSLDMPEAQSPTLMIQGVLGKLRSLLLRERLLKYLALSRRRRVRAPHRKRRT